MTFTEIATLQQDQIRRDPSYAGVPRASNDYQSRMPSLSVPAGGGIIGRITNTSAACNLNRLECEKMPPISVREAVQTAMQFVVEMFSQENLMGLRLEEVEFSEDGKWWSVTLSFVRGTTSEAIASALSGDAAGREYKEVLVSADDGTVRSVKIRQLV